MKKIVFVASICLFLSACGQDSAGVSAGSESSSSVGSGISIDKKKTISHGDSSETLVKMPASTLIADAFNKRWQNWAGSHQRLKDTRYGVYSEGDNDEATWSTMIELSKKDGKFKEEITKNFDPETKALFEKGEIKALIDVANRKEYERRFIACIDPLTGWEVSPLAKKSEAEVVKYMEAIANQCDFTNVIFTEIASKLSGKIISNPDEAREKIYDIWSKIDIETLNSAWKNTLEANRNTGFNMNLTGVKGVQFRTSGANYINEGGGFSVIKNGMVWFGQGALSGKTVDLSLRSTLSASIDKSKNIGSDSGANSGGKTGANINVK